VLGKTRTRVRVLEKYYLCFVWFDAESGPVEPVPAVLVGVGGI
jgi:hypothetical protein